MAKPAKAKILTAVLEAVGRKPQFVVARLEAAPLRKAWPAWADRRVKGTVNGHAFRTTLLSAKKGAELVLVVNRAMQGATKAAPGDKVTLQLEPDTAAQEIGIPRELADVLKGERTLAKWFARLSPSMQKGVGAYVDQAKGVDTRRERAARMAECLMLAMEGEQELPPMLRTRFQREPRAAEGWRAMTPLQRRNHLLGIFYLQSLEGRERRADQVVDDAVRKANRLRQR